MASELALRPVTAETRPVVERLWQLYRHDLSQFRGTHGPGPVPGKPEIPPDVWLSIAVG